jgi:hypothetical protein
MYADQTLACRDCGTSFVFTRGEQEFYERKGFANAPSRCPDCRGSSGPRRSREYAGETAPGRAEPSDHELFAAVCTECGTAMRVSARAILGDGSIRCPACVTALHGNAYVSTSGWRDSW